MAPGVMVWVADPGMAQLGQTALVGVGRGLFSGKTWANFGRVRQGEETRSNKYLEDTNTQEIQSFLTQ